MNSITTKADNSAPRTGSVTTTSGGPLLSRPSTRVALDIILVALHGKRTGLVRLWMLLRTPTGLSTPDIASLSGELGCCEKTVRNRMKRLEEMGWIIPAAGMKGTYQVRGWEWICRVYLGVKRPKLRIETAGAAFTEHGLKKMTFLAIIEHLNRMAERINDRRQRAQKRGVRSVCDRLVGLSGSLLSERTGMSRQWVSKHIGNLVKSKVLRRKFQWDNLENATAWDVIQARSDANQFEWSRGLRISPAGTVFRMKPSLLIPRIELKAVGRMPRKP